MLPVEELYVMSLGDMEHVFILYRDKRSTFDFVSSFT